MKNESIAQKGFTLIEVIITTAVVGFALVAFLSSNYAIEKASEQAYQKSVAIQDAQQVLEQIRNTAKTGTFPGNVTTAYPNNGTVSGFSNLTNEIVTVTYANAAATPLDVTVTVTYSADGTRASTSSIRTLLTQRINAS